MAADPDAVPATGLTTAEAAELLRVGEDKLRTWIRSGELKAIDTSSRKCGRPRYVILPDALQEFIRGRTVTAPAKPAPRRRPKLAVVDYYP